MRSLSLSRLSLLAVILCSLFSCKQESEVFTSEALADYVPLTAGKYITYRIDSMVFTNFGRNIEIHKYQVKHVIDAQITDNLGRPSYRVYRYLRDTAGTQPWQAAGSYFITPLTDQIEVIEDNLRFIKLHMPINDGFSWKGNRYLPADPYEGRDPNNSYDTNIDDWDFYFDNSSPTFSYRGFNYANLTTVEENNELDNVPITNLGSYADKLRAVEKYSKSIGLVYREYELWEYQPNTTGSGGPYYTGFGIKMWMIDHN